MAQEIIRVGSLPNDGTGDPLRVAFAKVNNNFTELYSLSTAEGPNGAIQYSTITIGSGAEGTAVLTDGAVSDIIITDPGSGYLSTNPPAIVITPGTGDTTGYGATASAIVTNGEVSGIVIDTSGAGYTVPPIVVFLPTTNTQLTGDANLTYNDTTHTVSIGANIAPIGNIFSLGTESNRFNSGFFGTDGVSIGNTTIAEVGNTAVIFSDVGSNVKANVGVGELTVGNASIFATSLATTVNVTEQTILTLPISKVSLGKIDIFSLEAATANTQSATITAHVNGDGTSVKHTVTGVQIAGGAIVQAYNVSINSGNVIVSVVPLVTGTVTHKISYQVTK